MINKFRGDYAFLSNFYSCRIEFDGLIFGSVEAAYQAEKTDDIAIKELFTKYDSRKAKQEGKKLVIKSHWHAIKPILMHNLLLLKFNDPELKKKLLDTGDEELVEGNTWGDKFWGVCDGEGENHLGKLLMKVREFYRNFE